MDAASSSSYFSTMEGMRDSTAVPQIVKIVRMFVKFHPLLTVTSLIFRVIFLQDWIKDELSNQWKILKVYCQLAMRASLDSINEKMKNLSGVLQMHLNNEATKGQLKAKVIGKLALFFATFLLLDTDFNSNYHKIGAKTLLLSHAALDLLNRSNLWSQIKILRGRCSSITNSTSNSTFFILALVFERFYDNSLRSLIAVLCIAIFLLCILVVLQPRTDLGLFSFIIGVIGSITYNRFKLMFPSWIIASICFVLISFKSWLDKNWLNLEEDQSLTFTNTMARSTSLFLLFSSTVVGFARIFFMSFVVKPPLSSYKDWLARPITIMLCYARLCKVNSQDSSLSPTNTRRINGWILAIVNVAQGIFLFALQTYPMADYKDWLFAIISYIGFCFWLRRFLPEDLSLPSTNAKGITSMMLSLKSVVTYSIVVLVGLEPGLYYRNWLNMVICYVLWWVWFPTSFPKYLSSSPTIEFKTLQWWAMAILHSTAPEVISWTKIV